jgi:zinc protease
MRKIFRSVKYVPIFILSLLFGSSIIAQFKLNDPIPVDPNVKIGKLSNGLTYYIRKNTKPEKKVQLRLVVNAGSVLEDADQRGLAHMMEHMNFNGLQHFQKNELVNYLQSIGVAFGADLNAYTGFDETVFILPIPTDNQSKIDSGFTILSDWAGNASLDTTEINKERGVVLEESRLHKNANGRMMKVYFPKLFNGSLYAERLPIGIDSIIENFRPESLSRFYKTWYRPDLMAVIVVGDIDPALAEKEIKEHFSDFKNPESERQRPSIIPITQRKADEAIVVTDKEYTYTSLQLINYVEKKKTSKTWEDFKETIIEDLFNTIINQRLVELTKQANPPFVYGNAGFQEMIRGYRTFISMALVGDKPVKDAVDALINTTESVKKFGFLQAELERAKSALFNQLEQAYNNLGKAESATFVSGYISNFLSREPIAGLANRYNFVKQVLPGITLAEVNALAVKMETRQGKFALLMSSDKNASTLPSNAALVNLVADANKQVVKPYKEKAIAKTLSDKKPTAGKIIEEKYNAVLGTTDYTLSNGITVTVKPTEFKNDEIQMDAWRLGGAHNYPLADKENAGNAAIIVQTMGVKDFSSTDLEKFLAGKTVSVQPYINSYEEGIEGRSNQKDFETFLQLVYLYFTQPRKDEVLFQSFITSQKAMAKNLKDNPFNYFSDTLTKIIFNNNPWAGGLPSPSDYDKINVDKLLSIYKNIFGNAYGIHFTFVGNLDSNKLKPLLELYLASLPSSPKENKYTDEGLRPVRGIVDATINKGAAKQSMVRIAFTGETNYSQDENLKIEMLSEVLNIKITEQLREEMSGIYGGGSSAYISKRPYGHYNFTIGFPCGPENVDKLTKALFQILDTLRQKGCEKKDLDKVKETVKKKNEDAIKENDHWLDALSSAWINNTDKNWILDYSKKVEEVTTKDILDAADKYIDLKNYIKADLYPEK